MPYAVRKGGHPGPAYVELPFAVELYDVGAGQEQSFTDDLKSEYLDLVIRHPDILPQLADPDSRLVISPISRLHAAALVDPVTEPFTIGTHHSTYLAQIGLAQPTQYPADPVTVAVLDNGFDETFWDGAPSPIQVGAGLDIVTGDAGTQGHGTLMAALITESAPGASVVPIRMGGEETTEWDAMHAIARAVDMDADVMTLSYRQYLLGDDKCKTCGNVRQAARSEVFEKLLDWAVTANGVNRAILVAAGNDGAGKIARPAVSPGVIPVTALDTSGGALASFANYDSAGLLDVLALPGDEVAVNIQDQSHYRGTSFATAYAAAVFAEAMMRANTKDAKIVLSDLKNNAPASYSNAAVAVLT